MFTSIYFLYLQELYGILKQYSFYESLFGFLYIFLEKSYTIFHLVFYRDFANLDFLQPNQVGMWLHI